MGQVLNFWNEDEAVDLFFTVYRDCTYENLCKYLEDYAPWLLKYKDRIWQEINL